VAACAQGAELSVSLKVREPAGVPRAAWPITSGVPLPRGAVREADGLVLRDDAGRPVPCQIDPAVRWPDGSLKWVHLHFQADLPAAGEASYTLATGRPVTPASTVVVTDTPDAVVLDTGAAKVTLSRKSGSIIDSLAVGGRAVFSGRGMTLSGAVRTAGPFRLSLPVNRAPRNVPGPSFDRQEIRVNSSAGSEQWRLMVVGRRSLKLVGSKTGEDGAVSAADVKGGRIWTSPSGAISIRAGWWSSYDHPSPEEIPPEKAFYQFASDASQRGKIFSTLRGKLERVDVEERGPMRACVYLQGTFGGEGGQPFIAVGKDRRGRPYDDPSGDFFKYRVRVYAFAGRPFVWIVASITHTGPLDGSPPAAFNGLTLHLAAPRVAADTPVRLGGAEGKVGTGARLVQLLGVTPFTEMRRKRNLSYSVTFDGARKAAGRRAVGHCLLGGPADRAALAVRRFWEYGPKGIELAPGRLDVQLWPAVAEFDGYRLCMGRQRTHELLLTAGGEAAGQLAAFTAPPLVALAPPAWYADCGVFGMIAEGADYTKGYPEPLREPLTRYERLMKCVVDPSLAIRAGGGDPGNVLTQFVPGWNDWGDLPWAAGWSNLHYDWTLSMVLHFLRTGKRSFFDAAHAMADHRKDIAQNHCGQCGRVSPYVRWSNYLTYYEKDDHRGAGSGPKPSHSWNRGLAGWYLLTGDPMARLVAVQSAAGLRGFYASLIEGRSKMDNPAAELRMYGWSIENFLGAYECTGERKHLDWALGLFRATFQAMHEGRKVEQATRMAPLMFGYSLSPVCRLHHYTRDAKVLAALRYLVDEALIKRFLGGGRKTADGKYLPYGAPYSWKRTDYEAGTLPYRNPPWNLFWPNPLAYLYMQTGEREYLKRAREIFRDSIYYYAAAYRPHAPEYRCNVAYFDGMFASTATKAHGWAGRFHHIYLYVEKQLARGAEFPIRPGRGEE
jgi:hypothetical protein